MKTYLKITIFAISALVLSNFNLKAQDAHLSQFDALPVLVNPSMTGLLNANGIRAGAQLRSQWGALASNITSAAFAVDAPLNERWGIGAYMLNNGQSKYFNVFNFVLSAAYTITALDQNKHFLSVGLQAGMILKGLKTNSLTFDSQYSNGNFDPDLPSGESFARNSRVLPELNYGIYYGFTDPEKKIHPYLGFSLFHITSPDESFVYGVESRLPRRWVLHGGSNIQLTNDFNIEPKILYMRQLNIQEVLAGMDFNYSFKDNNIKVMAGGYYRWNDAAIIEIGVNFKTLIYKMSYDINTSSLNTYSSKRGGIEFSVVTNGIGEKRFRNNH
jgi:type IX secretion system PorP/SprF family membrane protein